MAKIRRALLGLLVVVGMTACSNSVDVVTKDSGTCVKRYTDRIVGLKVNTEEYVCKEDE